MFNTSAQSRSWMFKNSGELIKRREAANRRYVNERANVMTVSIP